jgi:hypothetical protein
MATLRVLERRRVDGVVRRKMGLTLRMPAVDVWMSDDHQCQKAETQVGGVAQSCRIPTGSMQSVSLRSDRVVPEGCWLSMLRANG